MTTKLDTFSEVKPSITDFQKIFTFTATGLKPNTYYDVICQDKISNHCATQDPTRTNTYSKLLKRIKNIDSNGVNLNATGTTATGTTGYGPYNWPSDLPLKTDASGTVRFDFDGSTWIKDGGQGTSQTVAGATGSIGIAGTLESYDVLSNDKIVGQIDGPDNSGIYRWNAFNEATGAWITQLYGKTHNVVAIEGAGIGGLVGAAGGKIEIYGKGSFKYTYPASTNFKMNVVVRESNYVDPKPATPAVPLGPPDVPVGWSTNKPDVPANTVTERTLSSNTVTTSKDLGILRVKKEFGTGGQVPLSEVSLYFDYAQTFYLDPAKFDNSQYVTLTSINLYFKSKPHFKNNQSGLVNPGVYVFICDADNDIPNLRKAYKESIVRVDYGAIATSLDSTNFTGFDFKSPLSLRSGRSYAIVINFEDPQYSLWTATQGVKLIDSEQICDSAYNFGKLYRASNYLEIDNDPKTQDEVLKAIPATDLKFDIIGLEYTDNNGNLQNANIELVNDDYEFIQIQNSFIENIGFTNLFEAFGNRQYIYQDFGNPSANVFYYKPGRLSFGAVSYGTGGLPSNDVFKAVSSTQKYPQSTIITGTGTKFTVDVPRNGNIVITDGIISNTLTGFIANTCIRRVIYLR